MKMRIASSVVVACGMSSAAVCAQPSAATYRVTFDATWSGGTHTGAFPGGAHFSPLIGATHAHGSHLWELGGIASNGMKQMAETGATVVLRGEIIALQNNGLARARITGFGTGSPGQVVSTLDAHTDHPLVTLVSMIAPSPDWFIGTEGLDLRDGDVWREQIVFDLYAYDAGTDSGKTFMSPNQSTNPREPIRLLHDESPFAGTPALGTFTFDLLSIDYDCLADFNEDGLINTSDFLDYLNDYNAVRTGGVPTWNDPDLAEPFGVLNSSDLLEFLNRFTAGCI